jgi:preprotein translocase subunit SecG
MGIIIISSLVLIASILLSPGKSAGLTGTIDGGAVDVFGRKKAKGMEGILERVTEISAALFMISTFIYSII